MGNPFVTGMEPRRALTLLKPLNLEKRWEVNGPNGLMIGDKTQPLGANRLQAF